jgi:hypothetical protein
VSAIVGGKASLVLGWAGSWARRASPAARSTSMESARSGRSVPPRFGNGKKLSYIDVTKEPVRVPSLCVGSSMELRDAE